MDWGLSEITELLKIAREIVPNWAKSLLLKLLNLKARLRLLIWFYFQIISIQTLESFHRFSLFLSFYRKLF